MGRSVRAIRLCRGQSVPAVDRHGLRSFPGLRGSARAAGARWSVLDLHRHVFAGSRLRRCRSLRCKHRDRLDAQRGPGAGRSGDQRLLARSESAPSHRVGVANGVGTARVPSLRAVGSDGRGCGLRGGVGKSVTSREYQIGLEVQRAFVASVLVMRLTMPNAPYGVEVVSPILYGRVPEQPVWQGGLYLDLFLPSPRPAGRVPAVVYLHHGGWRAGDRSYGMYPWNAPVLAAHGFVVGSVSYRFSSVAPFPAQLHDVKAAVRWFRANAAEYGVDPDRIGAWGDSSGGQLAGLLGTTADRVDLEGECGSAGWSSAVRAAVTRCAPTDFRSLPQDQAEVLDALFGGPPSSTTQLRRLASPLTHVSTRSAPFLIVHGTRDETVPFDQAERMARKLADHGVAVTLHPIDGGYHNLLPDIDPPWGSEPWTELGWLVLEYFDRTLRESRSAQVSAGPARPGSSRS